MGKKASANHDGDMALSVARLVLGAVSLGTDKLADQVRRVRVEPAPVEAASDGPSSIGDLWAGVFTEAALAAGRLVSLTADGARRVAATADTVTDVPLVRPLTRPVRRRYRHGEDALRRLARRGKAERIAGRRIVGRLLRDAAASSFNEAAQVALSQVTQSPEVAELVRTQTTGVATETIMEIRSDSERADERIERRVHSWLHLRRSRG